MLLIALCNMITVFSSGWLAQSWVRFQMKDLNEKNIIIAIAYSIFIASALCLISFFINFDNNSFSLIFKLYNYGALTLMTVGMVLYYLIVSALQALLLSKYVLKISIILSIFCLILPFITYSFFEEPLGFIISYGIAYLISAVTGFYFFLKKNKSEVNPNKLKINDWFKYGAPISIWLSLQASIPFIERIFIQVNLGSEFVGQFTALSELINRGFSLLLFPITLSVQPLIIRYWNQKNKKKALKLWKETILLMGYLFLLVTLLFYFFYDYIIIVIKNIINLNIQSLLLIISLISISAFIWQVNIILHKPLELKKKTINMVYILIFSLLTIIVTNYFTIFEFGIIGTAVASFFGALIYGFCNLVYGLKLFYKEGLFSK